MPDLGTNSIFSDASDSIKELIAKKLKKDFDSITAKELKAEKNPVTSLSGRSAFAMLIQIKEKSEADIVKVQAFKLRYAEWDAAGSQADSLRNEFSLHFIEGDL